MSWVVVKASRPYTYGRGYAGPTCARAGVRPGLIYEDRHEAEEAASRLSEENLVGFRVEPYREY